MIRPKSVRIAYDSREPRSVFVAIEGLDGCGKSTVADSWYDTLSQREATLQVSRRFATVEVDTTNKTVPEVVRVIAHELQDRGVLR